MKRKDRLALLKDQVPGNGVVAQVAKDSTKVKLRAIIYPSGGAQPYEEDVQVKDDGTFTVKDSSLTYVVSRASVIRGLDGLMRVVVNESEAQTINISSLRGENILHPMTLNAIAENNYWQQWGDFLARRAMFRQVATWGMIALGICALLLIFWQVKTLGDGFDHLASAWSHFTAGSGATPTGGENGHQVIAPGA